MKKIIALKDSPLAKKGEVFNVNAFANGEKYVRIKYSSWSMLDINAWIAEGWFAYVEDEKTLSELFEKNSINTSKNYATIARDKALAIFDKALKETCGCDECRSNIAIIRKALEEKMV